MVNARSGRAAPETRIHCCRIPIVGCSTQGISGLLPFPSLSLTAIRQRTMVPPMVVGGHLFFWAAETIETLLWSAAICYKGVSTQTQSVLHTRELALIRLPYWTGVPSDARYGTSEYELLDRHEGRVGAVKRTGASGSGCGT